LHIFAEGLGIVLRNFTGTDIAGSVEASLLLILILFIPGYVMGWLTNVFDFRQRRLAIQSLLSTPLAVAVLPILVYWVGRYPKVLWTILGASWVGFLVLVRPIWKRWKVIGIPRIPRAVWVGCSFAIIWAVIAIATLVDLQFKGRLYFSVPAYDYSLRTALTAAAARAIPPANPFFASTPLVPLRYHYFWMLICSLVVRLGHVGPRQAMYGGTVWAGIALMSLIAISLKFFLNVREHFARKALIGCGLLLVTGLDILPTLYLYLRLRAVTPDMEWWNQQITSWADVLLWTPHHIIAVVASVFGFLLLRHPAATKFHRAMAILVAGLAFASSAGISVLVTFTFASFIVLWLPYAVLRRWWDDVAGLLTAGLIALIAALPYLRTLVGPAVDGSGGGGRFLAVSVRGFPLAIDLIASKFGVSPDKLFALSLPLLPLNYFFELGFFFVIGVLRIQSIRAGSTPMTRDEETGWMIVVTSFFIGSFLRSTTIGTNDLGWRCFLQAQLVLLLWGALLIDDWWSARRSKVTRRSMGPRFAGILLAIGMIGTIYQVAMLRVYPILHDEGKVNPKMSPWLDQDGQLGKRTYALRSVYDQLSLILPPAAIVQYNPNTPTYLPHQLYSGHEAAMGLPLCGAVLGGDVSRCRPRMESVVPLFEDPSLAESANLDGTCSKYGIDVMLVDDSDPVWGRRDSWAWTRTPFLANDHVRAFECGPPDRQARLLSVH
jgi:hypothetical protein